MGKMKDNTYVLVESQLLVGVFLCVFVRKSLRERIAEVLSES